MSEQAASTPGEPLRAGGSDQACDSDGGGTGSPTSGGGGGGGGGTLGQPMGLLLALLFSA
jgi:hypothetical protein